MIFGSFGEMLKEAWEKKDHPNMHFVFYEDLKADIDGELKKLNDFIGAGLNEQQLKNVIFFKVAITSIELKVPIIDFIENNAHIVKVNLISNAYSD